VTVPQAAAILSPRAAGWALTPRRATAVTKTVGAATIAQEAAAVDLQMDTGTILDLMVVDHLCPALSAFLSRTLCLPCSITVGMLIRLHHPLVVVAGMFARRSWTVHVPAT
jgi:hypothetical protein